MGSSKKLLIDSLRFFIFIVRMKSGCGLWREAARLLSLSLWMYLSGLVGHCSGCLCAGWSVKSSISLEEMGIRCC